MKKLTFLVTNSEKEAFISELRSLGVVHVVELQQGATSAELQAGVAEDERYKRVLKVLENAENQAEESSKKLVSGSRFQVSGKELVERVEVLQREEAQLRLQLGAAQQTAVMLRPLGEFDISKIRQLEEKTNLKMTLFSCFSKSYEAAWEETYFATVLAQDKSTTWFVTFSETTPEIAANPIVLPENSLSFYETEVARLEAALKNIEQEMLKIALAGKDAILAAKAENDSAISLARVQLSSTELAGGVVHLMEGWIPAENEVQVCETLFEADIFYEIEAPKEEDLVPIKFKNDPFTSIYERITKMYGFPCYQEWDPTILVAPFFTLFFAICMGDAGYGLLILAYGILEAKGKGKNVPILGEMLEGCGTIITFLGIATTIIGLCLGSFFGMDLVNIGWVPEDSAYGSLITWINGKVPGTNYSMKMAAALVIGVFHICLAMVVKAVMFSKRFGFKSQISVWGWIVLIIGGIITGIMAMTSVLSEDATKMVLIAIAAISALGIFILNDVKRNPLINIGAGLLDTYNMVTGLLGDVLSYLRLYALCLAGGMLGGAFNMMGDMVKHLSDGMPVYVSVFFWIFAIVIYAFGHLFNVLMSSISAFVHPLRLIFVEYFKNSGYEGKGIEYKPFK